MGNNKINMDDFFKSRLHNRNLEFDANDWLAMESLLDKNDRKRRRILPFFWLVISVALTAFLGFVLFNGNETGDKQPEIKGEIVTKPYEGIADSKAKDHSIGQLAEEDYSTKKDIAIIAKNVTTNRIKLSDKTYGQLSTLENEHLVEVKKIDAVEDAILLSDDSKTIEEQKAYTSDLQESSKLIKISSIPTQSFRIHKNAEQKLTMAVSAPSMMEKYVEPHLSLGIGGGVIGATSGYSGFEAGLVADYHFDRTWAIQTGFLYSQRNLGSIYSKIREDISYNFGQVSTIYGMNAQSLAYGSLPLLAYYKNEKNHFGGGVTIDFLLGVKGEIQEVTLMESIERNKIKDVKSIIQTGWIDMTAFQKTNARLQLNYRREILPSIFLGSNLSYQLSPILATSPLELNTQKTNKLFIGLNMQLFLK